MLSAVISSEDHAKPKLAPALHISCRNKAFGASECFCCALSLELPQVGSNSNKLQPSGKKDQSSLISKLVGESICWLPVELAAPSELCCAWLTLELLAHMQSSAVLEKPPTEKAVAGLTLGIPLGSVQLSCCRAPVTVTAVT